MPVPTSSACLPAHGLAASTRVLLASNRHGCKFCAADRNRFFDVCLAVVAGHFGLERQRAGRRDPPHMEAPSVERVPSWPPLAPRWATS